MVGFSFRNNLLNIFPDSHPLNVGVRSTWAFLPGTSLWSWSTRPIKMAGHYVNQGEANKVVTFCVPEYHEEAMANLLREEFDDTPCIVHCKDGLMHVTNLNLV